MPSVLLVGHPDTIIDALEATLASEGWVVSREDRAEDAAGAAEPTRELPPADLTIVVWAPPQMASPGKPLALSRDWAAVAATLGRTGLHPADGHTGLTVLLADRRALITDEAAASYGMALAEVVAGTRALALDLIPGRRLGTIVASIDQREMHEEVVAAVRLLAASPAMTGVVIELGEASYRNTDG